MILFILTLIFSLFYVWIIIAFTIGLKRVLNQNGNGKDKSLSISVIVAFRDEESNLPTLLESVLNQSITRDRFELILVNDHSSDESSSIVESYCKKYNNIRLLNLPHDRCGKKAALALGVDFSIYPVVAITDADCRPSQFWLETISNQVNKGSVLMIGLVIMSPIDTFLQKIQSLEYSSLMATAAGSLGIDHPVIASSANLAFRNDILNVSEIMLNPEISSGDDMFLLHHVKETNVDKIGFLNTKGSIVYTSTANSLRDTLGQRKRWASKSIHYKDLATISVGVVVLLFNLLLVFLLISSIFHFEVLYYFVLLLVIKSLVDFLLLSPYLRYTGQEKLMKVFLPLQLVYPFYLGYSFFAGVFIKGNWKGKKIK